MERLSSAAALRQQEELRCVVTVLCTASSGRGGDGAAGQCVREEGEEAGWVKKRRDPPHPYLWAEEASGARFYRARSSKRAHGFNAVDNRVVR